MPVFLGEKRAEYKFILSLVRVSLYILVIIITVIIITLIDIIIIIIGKEHELWSQAACVQIPTLPLTSCGTLTLNDLDFPRLSFLTCTIGMKIVSPSEAVVRVQ